MMQQVNTTIIYSFFGPPGSGKGTLAQKLAQKHNFKVLSTGNLCREHVAKKSDFGIMLDQYLRNGQLIPDDLITDMVINWLEQHVQQHDKIILDGFPRTQGQADRFLKYVNNSSYTYDFHVVLIELSENEIVKRLSQRLLCGNKDCQSPYTEKEKLTVCKLCGAALIKRDDDKEAIVRERLKSYPVYRDALFAFYASIGQYIEKLNIEDLSPEAVYAQFCSLFDVC